MKLVITEEDRRLVDAAVAAHDPTSWLMTNRIRLFSDEDAEWYADSMRHSLRGHVLAVMIIDALEGAITELGGTLESDDRRAIEGPISETFERTEVFEMTHHPERWGRLLEGTTDDDTDSDADKHFALARDAVRSAEHG